MVIWGSRVVRDVLVLYYLHGCIGGNRTRLIFRPIKVFGALGFNARESVDCEEYKSADARFAAAGWTMTLLFCMERALKSRRLEILCKLLVVVHESAIAAAIRGKYSRNLRRI